MKTAIVTGANGFIGSHIVYRLLAEGSLVHALGRGTATSQWRDRVIAALREVGDITNCPGELHCHEIDFNDRKMGLEFVSKSNHSPAETILFHVAGDTRFKTPDVALQRQVNVQAAVNVVSALSKKIATAIHVSTAFVAGTRTGLIREDDLDCGQEFRNSYEKSKFDAEILLTELCRKHELPLVIVRPSVITNDRESGRASTFTHLNALVEVISRIQEHYQISDGQVVSSRIRLMADPEARPNLAPVDSIIPPLLRIAKDPAAAGKTFHLCHPKPHSNVQLIGLICEAFKVKGKLALEFLQHIPKPISRTEEMILRSLKPYAPYLNNRCEFDLSHSRSVVPDYDSYFTQLDVPYIRKVIEFQRQNRK
ncbi:MAG: SDR family oxidoreductase [Limisphaerales bacterium]